MQLLINNIKVIGIFIVIHSIMLPTVGRFWDYAEYFYILIVAYAVFSLALFFLAGRFFINSTGILIYDCLSFLAITIIFIVGSAYFTDGAFIYLYCPHMFFIILFNQQTIGMIIAVLASYAAIMAGSITKNGIERIF